MAHAVREPDFQHRDPQRRLDPGNLCGNKFTTDISIDGEDGDLFCFTAPLQGKTTLVDNGDSTTATGSCGLAFRPGPGTRLQISDNNARTNVFLNVAEVEDALERTLDDIFAGGSNSAQSRLE